jgi:hypothetical protein
MFFNLKSWRERFDQARADYNAARVRQPLDEPLPRPQDGALECSFEAARLSRPLLDELEAEYRKMCHEGRILREW